MKLRVLCTGLALIWLLCACAPGGEGTGSQAENGAQPQSEDPKEQLSVVFTGKEFSATDLEKGVYEDFIHLDFRLTNSTDRDMAGAKVLVLFQDALGEDIMGLTFTFDDTIPAHSDWQTDNMGLRYNPFLPEHTRLRDADFSKMSI